MIGAMASSFATWYRGSPIPNTAVGSSSHFAHAYRGAEGSPVVRADVATTTASGGLETGGAAAPFVGRVVLAGGGIATGGTVDAVVSWIAAASGGVRLGGSAATTATAPQAPSDSFRYWRRGASVSSTAQSSSGRFDHFRRGSVGFPAVVRTVGASYSMVASGGASLGGTAELGPQALTASAAGGARLGGVAPASASLAVTIGGGLDVSGLADGVVSTAAPASGGWALSGRPLANLSASAVASGGATFGGSSLIIDIGYHLYINDGHGGPIDYATPADTVYGLSWTSPVLTAPSSYQFGVRAFGSTGLEECNLDASVRLDLDADGDDVTWVPRPPIGVRATPLAGGGIRVEWTAVSTDARRRPVGFNVYAQAGTLTDYTTPIAVVPFLTDRAGSFAAEINSLIDGATYAIGVRAWNASGEESNVSCIYVDADSSPPSPVGSLQATPIARLI